MGLSLSRETYETSQVLLTGGQVFISLRIGFLEDLPIQFTQLKMSEIILTERKPQKEKNKNIKCKKRGTPKSYSWYFWNIFFYLAEIFFFLAVPNNCNCC